MIHNRKTNAVTNAVFLVSFVEMAMGAGIAMFIVDLQEGDKQPLYDHFLMPLFMLNTIMLHLGSPEVYLCSDNCKGKRKL